MLSFCTVLFPEQYKIETVVLGANVMALGLVSARPQWSHIRFAGARSTPVCPSGNGASRSRLECDLSSAGSARQSVVWKSGDQLAKDLSLLRRDGEERNPELTGNLQSNAQADGRRVRFELLQRTFCNAHRHRRLFERQVTLSAGCPDETRKVPCIFNKIVFGESSGCDSTHDGNNTAMAVFLRGKGWFSE